MPKRFSYYPLMRNETSLEGRVSRIRSTISDFLASLNYEEFSNTNLLNSIPDHDLKVLCALSKKRELDSERDKVAAEIKKLWEQEKLERQKVIEKSSDQYKKYILSKREQERHYNEQKRLEKYFQDQLKTGQLIDYIMKKDEESARRLACQGDHKNTMLMNKAIEEKARGILASDRRLQKIADDAYRRELDLAYAHKKEIEARRRKRDMLRDAAQRVAFHNAYSTWESSVVRQEVMTMEAMKVASHAAKIAMTEARSNHLHHIKEKKLRKARIIALVTSQLREAVKADIF